MFEKAVVLQTKNQCTCLCKCRTPVQFPGKLSDQGHEPLRHMMAGWRLDGRVGE